MRQPQLDPVGRAHNGHLPPPGAHTFSAVLGVWHSRLGGSSVL